MNRGICFNWCGERPGPSPWHIDEATVDLPEGFTARQVVKYARETCQRCAAQWDCALYSVDIDACAGTWAGLTVQQRRWMQVQPRAVVVRLAEQARSDGVPMARAVSV